MCTSQPYLEQNKYYTSGGTKYKMKKKYLITFPQQLVAQGINNLSTATSSTRCQKTVCHTGTAQ